MLHALFVVFGCFSTSIILWFSIFYLPQGKLQDSENFNYVREIGNAYLTNNLSDDVTAEIDKVKAADLIIFQFPMQWLSVPAILKGWFDRVLITEFAFKFPQIMDNGLLKVWLPFYARENSHSVQLWLLLCLILVFAYLKIFITLAWILNIQFKILRIELSVIYTTAFVGHIYDSL